MEIWDIYDENRNKTGRTIERGQPLKQGDYHTVVHIWIVNSNGQFITSKRTPNKTSPNMWEVTGGSVIAGENSLHGALREVQEEIGVSLNPENGMIVLSIKRDTNFLDVWLFKQDVDISKCIPQPFEVSEVKLATKAEILKMIADCGFIDDYEYIDIIFKEADV